MWVCHSTAQNGAPNVGKVLDADWEGLGRRRQIKDSGSTLPHAHRER
jgi:hypothetical protein